MQFFSADAIVFSKVAHNRPPTFFLCTGPAAETAQKQKSRTTKSPLMQDWVFRLEFDTMQNVLSTWQFLLTA